MANGELRTEPLSPGDRVVVSWMGDRVQATVWEVRTRSRNGRVFDDPRYRLTIAGVHGHPMYLHSEVEADRA